MILLSANNAQTTLANGISASTLTIILATGTGAKFPSPTAGQFFTLTLNDALTQNIFEICYCTARTGDNLTVSRGQEGTTAQSWLIGDSAYNTLTARNTNFGGRLINVRTFVSSGTYTPTAGMENVIFEVQGGGGSGAGASGATGTNVSVGAPGTSGAYAQGIFSAASVGASLAVTVGAGGVTATGGKGTNGGTSSVGTLITCPGGVAGNALNNQSPPTLNGGTAFTATPAGGNIFSALGSSSSFSIALNNLVVGSGPGGTSQFGAGGFGVGVNTTGASGINAGSGGSGSITNAAGGSQFGGNGATGIVIAWEYS